MDTQTVLNIIKMIENQQDDIRGMIKKTRPFQPWDSQWVFKDDMVLYGAETALHHLSCHLQDYIEAQLNAEELKTGE